MPEISSSPLHTHLPASAMSLASCGPAETIGFHRPVKDDPWRCGRGGAIFCLVFLFAASLAGCAPEMKIENIEPASSNVGDVVVLQGYGFGPQQGDSRVLFDFAHAAQIVSWSDTEIVLRVPEGVPFGHVYVTAYVTADGAPRFDTGSVLVEADPIVFRILAFGDSITAGVSTSYGGYTYYLEAMLDAEKSSTVVVNGGVGGELTSDGLSRFTSTLTKWNDIVFVLLMEGSNDVTDSSGVGPLASIVHNLRQMIQIARDDYGKQVVLGTVLPRRSYENDQESPTTYELVESLRALASDENVPLADHYHYFTEMEDWQDYFFDSLHPNDQGYQVLADSWYLGALESIL
jgi:lysophospholipase L1-like esterase